MAVVFLEGGLSPIPMRMASTKLYREPHRGVCQFHRQMEGLTKVNQTQLVAESRISSIVWHHVIEISSDHNYQKITRTTIKTNKLTGAVKGRGRTILRSELHIPLTKGFLRDTARATGSVVATGRRRLCGGSENQGKVSFMLQTDLTDLSYQFQNGLNRNAGIIRRMLAGRHSTAEKEFLNRFAKAAGAGLLLNVQELKVAYEKAIGHPTSNSTIYNLLGRHNWRKVMPRPFHPDRDPKLQKTLKKGSALR
jgi:hypothetical protein